MTNKVTEELRDLIAAIPKNDRGLHWQLRDAYTGDERLEVHGAIAKAFKYILDNTDAVLAALSLKEAEAVGDALDDDVSLLRTGLKIAKTTEKSLRQQLTAALAALSAPVATQAEAREAALADIVRAWEALPGGQQQPMRAVEKWLADEMAPSINRIRALLTEGEAYHG